AALGQMCHVTVEPEQLVAPAQALTLGVEEENDGFTRALAHALEHGRGHAQAQVDADLGAAGRADRGDGLVTDASPPGEAVIVGVVGLEAAAEEGIEQFVARHAGLRARSAVATNSAASIMAISSGVSMPSRRQISGASSQSA